MSGQCFSTPGNPVGGSANMGTLYRGSLSVISYFKHSEALGYYEGRNPVDFNLVEKQVVNLGGLVLAYGVTNKITAEMEVGYAIHNYQRYSFTPPVYVRARGLSNGVFSIKTGLFQLSGIRLKAAGATGIKFPYSSNPRYQDGMVVPVQIQPSTNALGWVNQLYMTLENSFSGIRILAYSRLELNAQDQRQYRYGSFLVNSVFLSKHQIKPMLGGDWTYILQLRHEWAGIDRYKGEAVSSTGFQRMVLGPQINYGIHELYNFSLMLELPLYRNVVGTQLAARWAVMAGFSTTFE